MSADQLFRAARDGKVRIGIEFYKSDLPGNVRVYGSTLTAYLIR